MCLWPQVVETWLQWSAMQALDNADFRRAAFAMLAWLADQLHEKNKVCVCRYMWRGRGALLLLQSM